MRPAPAARTYTVVQIGLGPVGISAAKLTIARANLHLVGAIDPDPSKAGRDLSSVLGLERNLEITVAAEAEDCLRKARPSVVLHCTGSSLGKVLPELLTAIDRGANVVSSCEELSFPYGSHDELAAQIDSAARSRGVSVLGTGVNPGFAMDTLPIALTGACQQVDHIRIRRVQDAGLRREPLQHKVGVGLTIEEFNRRVALGTVRHVGLSESTRMVANTLGFALDQLTESIEMIVAQREVTTSYVRVLPGQVAGVRQVASGRVAGNERVRLELEIYAGAAEPLDEVTVTGVPALRMIVPGGLPGDVVTAAILVNAIPRVVAAPAGLITMRDLPPLHP